MPQRFGFLLILLLLSVRLQAADTAYLFTYFTHNGQDGLHLACSEDGLKWEALNGARSYLTPKIGSKEKLMRDPCVVCGPDGTYHMVWTSGWWEKGIGYASTKDFIHWSEQRELPVMAHEPAARNCWAPEIVYDETKSEFVIFWSTTIPGRFAETDAASEDKLNHRIYCTTTKDFQTFTPTALFYDPGFSCIDATFLRADGKQWLIVKDETKFPEPKKHLRLAEAKSVRGPFGPLSEPFTPPKLWVEGPTAIKIGDLFYVYFDAYSTKQYGAMRSRDLKNWETVSTGLVFPNEGTPDRMRHGTVIEVPRSLVASLRSVAEISRTRESFNSGWRFTRGDPANVGDSLIYERVKDWVLPTGDDLLHYQAVRRVRPEGTPGGILAGPNTAPTYTRSDFNDSGWRTLTLPHDWGIEGPFQQELSGDTGKLPWFGIGWYRKNFALPATDAGRKIYLELDGAMAYALVWCNGQFVGGWPYGYTSWRIDLTSFLKPGADNVLAIRLDNPRESSRWYPGGGIYRNVWLLKTAPVAVAQWGVFVTTPVITRESAAVDVGITLTNQTATAAEVNVAVRLFAADAEGHVTGEPLVSSAAQPVKLQPGRQAEVSHTMVLASPKLWSLKERNRYVAETTVMQGEQVIDRVVTPFGVRTIACTANDGFLLNGERVPLNGVCDHHDLGALGSAVNTRAIERQLEILQAMGCNAIRTSHNPPAPELLELCDRMGFVVMVEAFDCWRIGKKRDDYSRVFDDWHEKDLVSMVRRDRNHPSVIQWSIGNEIREQYEPDGWKLAAHLASIVREEDRTRPVVAGLNNIQSAYNGFQTVVDIIGYNYKPTEYANVRARYPHLPLMGSETASTVSSRGEYFFPVSDDKAEGRADFQVSSYDLYAPRWAFPPDPEWKGLDEAPYTLGEFVWTGFDYLGEPTPYNADVTNLLNYSNPADREKAAKELADIGKIRVPSRSSYFGIIDLAGFPKDRYYIYQARWRPDLPMAHILPHWNWPERIGQVTPVFVYSSGDEAELFLNGKSLGRQKRGPLEYRFRWNDVVYAPGELKVVAYKAGKKWAEAVQHTTGPAAKLLLTADRAALRAGGTDLSFITVTIADQNGFMVPRSKNRVSFEISGPGEIVATDNGDATSFESFQAKERAAYNGLALVVVRTKAGETGSITVRAKSDGLVAAEINLVSQ